MNMHGKQYVQSNGIKVPMCRIADESQRLSEHCGTTSTKDHNTHIRENQESFEMWAVEGCT